MPFIPLLSLINPYLLPPLVKINVGIDATFTVKEKESIIKSFINWQEATQGMIIFHLGNFDMQNLINHDDDLSTWFTINIVKALSTDLAVKKMDVVYKKTNGFAISNKKTSCALIVTDRALSIDRLINVTMHEIGHLLGLPHSPIKESIMYKYSSGNTEIHRTDLVALMKAWRDLFRIGSLED